MHPHILPHPEALNPHSEKSGVGKMSQNSVGDAVFLPQLPDFHRSLPMPTPVLDEATGGFQLQARRCPLSLDW